MSLKVASVASAIESDDGYPAFEQLIRSRVAAMPDPAFTTNADGLFDLFLNNLTVNRRQFYNCHCCRNFVNKYGGIASIGPDGEISSVLWEYAPGIFNEPVGILERAVLRSKVTGVFLSRLKTLGNPQTGEWSHLSGENPRPFRHGLKNDNEIAAEKVEDYGMMRRSIADFPKAIVAEAVRVLQSDALDRSEKTLGPAKWLLDLHQRIESAKGSRKDNLIWLAIATAPPGFTHVRSSMIGSLLEDIQNGMDFETVSRRWKSKMHPLQYQRPSTVNEGNLEQAEKAFAKMGAANSLKRRFARMADIVPLWMPQKEEASAPSGSVFGHLKPKAQVNKLALPGKTMTWEKFARDILPSARRIELNAPSHGQYFGLVTAEDITAPPILQWDTDPRNPVSWYFYHGGSSSFKFNLEPGWVTVKAICRKPSSWHHPEKFGHQGDAAFLILEGAKDMRHTAGGGLFPECCRSEFHAVRKAIEAYTLKAAISGRDEGDANGLAIDGSGGAALRVNGDSEFRIDRWE